jgi:hypothetical protein
MLSRTRQVDERRHRAGFHVQQSDAVVAGAFQRQETHVRTAAGPAFGAPCVDQMLRRTGAVGAPPIDGIGPLAGNEVHQPLAIRRPHRRPVHRADRNGHPAASGKVGEVGSPKPHTVRARGIARFEGNAPAVRADARGKDSRRQPPDHRARAVNVEQRQVEPGSALPVTSDRSKHRQQEYARTRERRRQESPSYPLSPNRHD